jgi:hypothetical protein
MTGVIHRPSEGPCPQRGSTPADLAALAREQARSQALLPQERWRFSPLTTSGDGGKAGISRLDASLRHVIIKEPDPGPCAGALPSATGSPHLSNKKAASSTVAKMASLVKSLLAGSLFVFASVHAGVASHRGSPRDSSSLHARSGPVVTVKNGSYEGLYSSQYDQDFFLGMRYSQVRATSVTRSYDCCCSLFPFSLTGPVRTSTASRALLPRTAPGLHVEWD